MGVLVCAVLLAIATLYRFGPARRPKYYRGFSIGAVTAGRDAQGEVSVKISSEGATAKGYGLSTDVIEASILAYVNAINNLIYGNAMEQE